MDDEGPRHYQYLFTREALEQSHEAAHERLREYYVMRIPESGKIPAGTAQAFYAQKLPELCRLCSAPQEVLWTSLIFFKRFFSANSPMEFDPVPMMFTCLHVACKVEEFRDLTLEKMLQEGGFGEQMRPKVTDLEPWNAVLQWPASVLIAAAWDVVLEEAAAEKPSPVCSMLLQSFTEERHKTQLKTMFQEAVQAIKQVNCKAELNREAMQEIAKAARKCEKAFERIREEQKQRHEARCNERKRRRNEDARTHFTDIEELKRKAQALREDVKKPTFQDDLARCMEED
eukprot:s1214_g10.t1